MSRFRVLVTDRFDLDAMALLKSEPKLDTRASAGPQPTREELEGVEGLIIRSRTKIDAELLSRAAALKVAISCTSGFDHIDFQAAAKSHPDLQIMYTPDANAASACELTWALLQACARRLPSALRATRQGDWKREALVGRELSGKTLGVIGLGRIGARVARVGGAFGMKIVAFDPYKDDAAFESAGAARVSLDELFRIADAITLHVPATPETRHMINRNLLESTNRETIFVNTSRGAAVTEKDLLHALRGGWIASAGLDVFEREPLARDSELLALDNVIATPHLGATTAEAFCSASRQAAEKLLAFVETGAVSDPLPPNESWWHESFGKFSK